MRIRCRELVLGAALCLALSGISRAQEALEAPSGERGWWVAEVADQVCVRDRMGETSSCWPQSLGQVTSLRETAAGWIAAGSRAVDRELFLFRNAGNGLEVIAPPSGGTTPRGRPALIADETRLQGLVWLEGVSQDVLEVRAAEWLGASWSEVATVSPAGPGSQVAPAVTVLDDGSWLLVWTAFDGEDDETVWSLYDHGRWSAPGLLNEDNTTPDIVPAVLSTKRGAIAAWSWLDGRDYRLRTAFFNGTSWRLDPPFAGRGALGVRLADVFGTILLSFETVVPEQWVIIELDATGRALRRASLAHPGGERPLVASEGSEAVFSWLDGESTREVAVVWDSVDESKEQGQ